LFQPTTSKEKRKGLVKDIKKSKSQNLGIFSKISTGENRLSLRREHFL